jgi:hypothetical protein
MPRTKSSKKDNRTPLEKLERMLDSKVDLLIFFQYYDGYSTEGSVGFNINVGPAGSSLHRTGILAEVLTKDQFRSKGKKVALVAKAFIESRQVPPPEWRPTFDIEEIANLRETARDHRSPEEKLTKEASEVLDLFIFFKYYDGYSTGGEIGFSPNSGPPGSINHKRAYARTLASITESQFRDKGKVMAGIAKELFECDIAPPEDMRPGEPEREVPWGMIQEALNATY